MEKYIKPEINIELLEIEDIITTSADGSVLGRYLKSSVNGIEGTDYGTQDVSVFE